MTMQNKNYNTVIAGGGIAGLVTALELLKQGQTVCIVDRDTPERIGGLARWAFGGMALSQTKQQRKMGVEDSPETLLKDWHAFAEFEDDDFWPRKWAKEYADNNNERIYQWLCDIGLKFLPAVNWVERGLFVPGNALPRYHVLWGTGWGLVEAVVEKLKPFIANSKLTILHQHKVLEVITNEEVATGVKVLNEAELEEQKVSQVEADNIVIACGGINGSAEKVKENWYRPWGEPPESFLNGANPISDGQLHQHISELGGNLTHVDKMWNYAAGISHPQADFEGHGLSLIPCKSALWLDHTGKRIGPLPLVTGFDTNYLCEQVAKQDKYWTWQVLNWKIAAKELAVSGSKHNPSIRDKKLFSFLKEILLGNHRLVKQLEEESGDFVTADSLEELVERMNQQTDEAYVSAITLKATLDDYDERLQRSDSLTNDDQVRRIEHARKWKADKLRTCKPAPIQSKDGGKLIAIKVQLISRKSLGGIQTNLQSQVIRENGQIIKGLYCVGEAAGFGGGGASGKRSLEGTFLSGCILTARNAADEILAR